MGTSHVNKVIVSFVSQVLKENSKLTLQTALEHTTDRHTLSIRGTIKA